MREGCSKKGVIWVLRDEILHCVQNDKGEQGAWYRSEMLYWSDI